METIPTCLSGLDERQVPYVCAVQSTCGVQEALQIKYWFSTLPPDISLQRLVTLAHARLRHRAVLRAMPNRNVVWTTSRGAASMACIGTWLWLG
jgi:hypothetical protein